MPRKSAAALSIIPRVDVRQTRLKPRADMPPQVRDISIDLVAHLPPEHFRPTDAALVEQYSQAIVWARRAHLALEADGGIVDGRCSPWLVTLEKAHRSSVALAARLRLSPQSRCDPKVAGRQPGPKPSYYETMMREQTDE